MRVQKESEELLTGEREQKKEMQETLQSLETEFDEELRREEERMEERMDAQNRAFEARFEARLAELKEYVDKRQADTDKNVDELREEFGELRKIYGREVSELQKRQDDTEKELAKFAERQAASDARIRALEAQVSTLEANDADAKRQIRAHEARASSLQADIAIAQDFQRGSGLPSNALDSVCSRSSAFWAPECRAAGTNGISLLTGKISTWLASLPPAPVADVFAACDFCLSAWTLDFCSRDYTTAHSLHHVEQEVLEHSIVLFMAYLMNDDGLIFEEADADQRQPLGVSRKRTEEERGSVSVGNSGGSGSGEEDTADDAAFRGCGA